MTDVVLHGPSWSPSNPKVTPEAIADAVNLGLDDKANQVQVDAVVTSTNTTIATAQQRIDSLTASLAYANSQITSLQSALTATQNRVTVLENATPPPAVPNAVASFSLGATTNTTQVLGWTAPSSGPTPTFYDTKYKTAGSATWSNGPSVAAGTLTATVTGLTAGTSYDYSVVTRNAAGPGASSPTLTRSTTTSFTPSPAWTEITDNTGVITMANGDQVTIVNGVMKLNGANMATTGSVNLALINNANVIYQRNIFNDWWYWVPSTASWTFTSDPRATAPPPPGATPPAPAAAVGYNKRTLGPRVILSGPNQNWFQATNISTNADGSVTLRGGNSGFNYDAVTGDGHSFGTAFGGGLYIEMDHSWTGGYSAAGGWPSYWANAVESRQIPAAPNWPAGIADGGGYDAIEWDILETFSDGWGPTIWDWSDGRIGNRYGAVAGAWNAVGGVHRGPFDGRRKKVGALWIPATPSTQGRTQYYLDGVLIPEMTIVWDRWTSSVGLPLVNGHTAGAIIDFQHMNFIMGTGPNNPMTVYTMEIWQANGSSNLPPTP